MGHVMVGILCTIKRQTHKNKEVRYHEKTGAPYEIEVISESVLAMHNDIIICKANTITDLIDLLEEFYQVHTSNHYNYEKVTQIIVGLRCSETESHRDNEEGFKCLDISKLQATQELVKQLFITDMKIFGKLDIKIFHYLALSY